MHIIKQIIKKVKKKKLNNFKQKNIYIKKFINKNKKIIN